MSTIVPPFTLPPAALAASDASDAPIVVHAPAALAPVAASSASSASPALPALPPLLPNESKKRRIDVIVIEDEGQSKAKRPKLNALGKRGTMRAVLRDRIQASDAPEGHKLLGIQLHHLNEECARRGGAKCVYTNSGFTTFVEREAHTAGLEELRHYAVSARDGFARFVPLADKPIKRKRNSQILLPAIAVDMKLEGIPLDQLHSVGKTLHESYSQLLAEQSDKKKSYNAKLIELQTAFKTDQSRLVQQIRTTRTRLRGIQALLRAVA